MRTARRHSVSYDTATNWEESIHLNPEKIVYALSPEQIAEVMKNAGDYPSPVRTIGSRHSTTHCGVSDGGTLLIMRRMERILTIDAERGTVTVEAGALYIDVARALEKHGLQFYVNVEIGNLTMGAAATTGTKDASMPGEYGQVCSYVDSVRMVLANGDIREVTDAEPELLRAVRSSYGLLGVIYEVTFRVKPLQAMAVHHRTFSVDAFAQALPGLREQGDSIMYYLYPFLDSVTVELRRYLPGVQPANRWIWIVRNYVWKSFAPALCHAATRYIGHRGIRFKLIDAFYRLTQWVLTRALHSRTTYAGDQIIRYPQRKGFSKYTFSIWAFPEEQIIPTLRAYYAFCRDYYARHGYRCDMLNVGYRIAHDTNPMFSYSFAGTVMTLDPVATAREAGWDDFLRAYNQFCSDHGGVPLFNQSKWLTREQVHKAFGERISEFESHRAALDPEQRLLNDYFRELFAVPATRQHAAHAS